MLSKSRFSRRLHRVKAVFIILFDLLGYIWKSLNTTSTISLLVFIFLSVTISEFQIHLMETSDGQPVECFLTHGGFGDVEALKYYAYELPDGSVIYADKAYNDYEIEDLLKEIDHISLLPMHKKNSKRALPPYVCFVQSYYRKMVEIAGSLIEQLLPKSIHAVTSEGFELKGALFVIAYRLDCYLKL